MKKKLKKISLLVFIATFILMPSISNAQIVSVEPISVSSNGVLGDGNSASFDMTPYGRYVVLFSDATNLVADDTNGYTDIFVRDRELGTTERVSVSSLDEQSNENSNSAFITSDGRYVYFDSEATNLVPNDTNDVADVFVHDRQLGTTNRVIMGSLGEETDNSSNVLDVTPDGKYVFFESGATNLVAGGTNGNTLIYMLEVDTGEVEIISLSSSEVQGNLDSHESSGSADGRYVSFSSSSTNLVPNDTNNVRDIFVRDRVLGTTERVSVSSDGVGGNGSSDYLNISSDGRFIVFVSSATNLVPNDTNGVEDIFVHDRILETTKRVNVSSNGTQANADAVLPSISDNGRFITFGSSATNLVAGDTNGNPDVFVHDMLTGNTDRVSLKADGTQANGGLMNIAAGVLSGNARYIILSSDHSDIIAGDTNGSFDVFLYELDDDDGIDSTVELAAPNAGDVNENNYVDSVEQNITSFVNTVSGTYTTVETTGDCVRNDSPSAVDGNSFGSPDSGYEYPSGIITFRVDCMNAGETATVSIYFFSDDLPVQGTIARKYNSSTGEYTTIDSAVIEEVTIDGERALKMTYDVVDGGSLDEDGLENGIIMDPVGFARVAETPPSPSSGSSIISSGSIAIKNTPAQNIKSIPPVTETTVCTKQTFTTPMKKGSKQGEVSKLQATLNKLNFSVGIVDGLFGPMTHKGVQMFQTANALDPDGIVGPLTRNVLNTTCL